MKPNSLRIDPTRTTLLRKKFAAEMFKRFNALKGELNRLIVDEDAFGLRPKNADPFTTNYNPSQPRDSRGRWGSGGGGGSSVPYKDQLEEKVSSIQEQYKTAESERLKAQEAFMEEYGQGTYEDVKDKPSFIEVRSKYNEASDVSTKLRDKMANIKDELAILEKAGPLKKQIQVRVKEGVDVHPEIAQALVEISVNKPWADEGPNIASRYVYELSGVRSYGAETTYKFEILNKHEISPLPKGELIPDNIIPERQGFVYRGMSHEEWNDSIKRGGIASKGDLNLGQEGLTFYGRSDQAHHYATGFAPMAYTVAPGNKSVVVEIPRELVMDTSQDRRIPGGEFAHTGSVPLSSVSSRYEVHATNFKKGSVEVVYSGINKKVSEGSRSSPHTSYSTIKVDTIIANSMEPVLNTRWKFNSDPQKMEAFRQWLIGKIEGTIIDNAADPIGWWRRYVLEAYAKGLGRSFDDVRRRGADETDFYRGSRREFIKSAFSHPVSLDRVKILGDRVLSDLRGVNDAMATQMQRVLIDGLAKGDGPREVARNLNKRVDAIGITRARTIARTETIRAHAEGQLDSLEKMGISEVGVAVEWSTAGFNVCPLCSNLEGVVLSIKEATGMLPRHPNCRCSWIPAGLGEDDKNQKKTKARIQDAIRRSIKAESSKRSVEEQKKRTSWAGADLEVSKDRPEPTI